jgi:hypothetical protein
MAVKPVSSPDPVPSLRDVHAIAANTASIVILVEPKRKAKARGITRRQVELCCQKGTFLEGPFRNERHDWQVTMFRHAAGEEIKVVVIIKDGRLLIRSNH